MATYNINKFAYNGDTYNLVPDIDNIPVASATNKGIVSIGNQTFAGVKKFYRDDRYASICLGTTHATNFQNEKYGPTAIVADFGHDSEIRGNRIWFIQYSPTAATGSYTFTGNREIYKLPWCENGMTESKEYAILTTKEYGPTATATLFSDTFNSSSAAVTLPNAMQYSLLCLLGKPGVDINTSLVVPTANLNTTAKKYQITGQNCYFSITLKRASSSSNDVTMAFNAAGGGNADYAYLSRVYGIR